MKRLGWILLIVIILLGLFVWMPNLKKSYEKLVEKHSDFEKSSSWQKFVPQSRLFKVMLPSSPQYAKDYVPIPNSDKKRRYDMYASEKIDGTLFLISVITYPPEIDTSLTSDILRQSVEELMRSKPDNTLHKLQEGLYNIHPSIDFSFNSQEFHVEGKAVIVNKIMYVLSYITKIDQFDEEEYQYFINSFELINQPKQ